MLTQERYSTRVDFRGNDQHNFAVANMKNNDMISEEFIFYYDSFIYLYIYLFIT